MLLDVNNAWINAANHGTDARAFIAAIDPATVGEIHLAGGEATAAGFVDTHGAPVKDDVWSLLGYAYSRCGPCPTVLERDFNIPPLEELLLEVQRLRAVQAADGRTGSSALGH